MGPSCVGSSTGSTLGPRCQLSATARMLPDASKTRPVTSRDSRLASQVTIGAIQRGLRRSRSSSLMGAEERPSVSRVRAPGAMALQVIP